MKWETQTTLADNQLGLFYDYIAIILQLYYILLKVLNYYFYCDIICSSS